jgi:hypothetical protein
LALLAPEPSFAHVDVRPRLVEQGVATALLIELPRLRPGPAPVRLEVEGDGVTVLGSTLAGPVRDETVWNGRVRVDAEPGVLPVVLRAVYADGNAVEVDASLTVVPPEQEESEFPWPMAIVGVALALSLAGGLLAVARRRA